jgi:hypothetical protein
MLDSMQMIIQDRRYREDQSCSLLRDPLVSILVRAVYLYVRADKVNYRSIFYDALASMGWNEAAIGDADIMASKANLSQYLSNVIIRLHSATTFYVIGMLVIHIDDVDSVIEMPIPEFTLKM